MRIGNIIKLNVYKNPIIPILTQTFLICGHLIAASLRFDYYLWYSNSLLNIILTEEGTMHDGLYILSLLENS